MEEKGIQEKGIQGNWIQGNGIQENGIPDPWPDHRPRRVLPADLENMAPGPELGRLLSAVDRRQLNGYELLTLLQARARQVAHLQAELLADTAEVGHAPPGYIDDGPHRTPVVDEFASDEIRAALHLTRRGADRHFDLALGLCEVLPTVWEALRRGDIDLGRARVIHQETSHLEPDEARRVAERILTDASVLTSGQVGSRARTLCMKVDPESARRRYERANTERQVVAHPSPNGTANLSGLGLPPDRVCKILNRLNGLAHRLGEDGRSIDQKRADVFMDLLEGTHAAPSTSRPVVDIRVDLPTLIGLAEHPGHIPGWGPVVGDIARQAVKQQPDGEWRVAVTNPDNGAVLWDGTTRRRPTAGQRRHIETRQPTCAFPGCRNPAGQSDLDHTLDRAKGGPTLISNLEPLCRHDHRLKHEAAWTLEQPTTGTYVWTSPHGHRYTTTAQPP